jgi:3-oxoacyl-[acyl-carrier protein] reductase
MADLGQVAVVTGAGRGIGRVVAERLAASGFRVAAVGRSAEPLAELSAASGAFAVELDVSDAPAVARAWARIESEVGVPTLLVNNAGLGGVSKQSWEQEPADWWRVFEVNVLGAYLVSRAALPSMLAGGAGRIVNVSSNAAFFPAAGDTGISSAYMASKAALIRFTEALAGEVAGSGVTVLAISPGTVKTDMAAAIFAEEWDDPDFWSPPELTADLVEFVATGALDALSGRYVHAANDDWRALASRPAEVLQNDWNALRVRTS